MWTLSLSLTWLMQRSFLSINPLRLEIIQTLRWFLRKSVIATFFLNCFLNTPCHRLFQKGHWKDWSPCLFKRYDRKNIPDLCKHWSRAVFHRFTVHFVVAKSKGFKVTPKKKNLIGRKSLERMESLTYSLRKKHSVLNNIDSIFPIFNGITCIPKSFDKKYRLPIMLV